MKLFTMFVLGVVEGGILLDWFRSRQALQVKQSLKKPLKGKKGYLFDD